MEKIIANVTYGHDVISDEVQPAMCADRQCRVIRMKRPRGRKVIIAIFQQTMQGEYCSHSVLS